MRALVRRRSRYRQARRRIAASTERSRQPVCGTPATPLIVAAVLDEIAAQLKHLGYEVTLHEAA
jgi:hypothetical protein